MKKTIIVLFAVLSTISLKSQIVLDYLKGADDYYKKGDYASAADYYEKYLNKGKSKVVQAGVTPYAVQAGKEKKQKTPVSSNEQATYNLAESYRKLHYHVKAEPVYAKTLDFDKSKFPLARYWYAMTLRALEKYAESEAAFKQFLEEYQPADEYRVNAAKEMANLRYAQEQMLRNDLRLYKVSKAGGEVADSGASFAPVWFNNAVYFSSTKADNSAPRTQVNNNRIYQASYQAGNFSAVTKLPLTEEKDIHQNEITFAPDGNTIYYTRGTIESTKKTAAIYRSTKTATGWSEPVALGSTINVAGFNSRQAFMMPDGKHLIFSSDQPGGQGGFDLWSVELDANGNAGTPENLGSKINSAGDEQAPYFHAPTSTLVFSSNGRVGMGGYDFFYSKGELGNWTAPVNYGFPVNSVKDDLYFTSRGDAKNILDDVIFSSDRNDVCCLELFSLHKDRLPREIKGIVVACDNKTPMAGATVTIMDTINNRTVHTQVTDAQGTYTFTVDDYQPLKAVAAASGYYSSSIDFNGPQEDTAMLLINPDICLNAIVIEKPVVVENVLYDFNKAVLKPQYYPEVDKLVVMLNANPDIVIEISSHTDNIGSDEYNQKLSLARAQSIVNYLVKKGIKMSQLKVQGYGEAQPVAPNENEDGTDNPEGRQQNRRSEFKVLKNS
jgi:OmpA-OmpF porin, OOP family